MHRTPPRGRMTMTIRDRRGAVTMRQAKNIVVQNGAQLIANLFAGKSNTPVDRVRIGFGTEVAHANATTLTRPNDAVAANLEAPLKPGAFTVEPGDTAVTVRINAPFEPKADIPNV